LPIDPLTQITITAGATEALYATITAVINKGDEVILFDPAYDSYDPVIRLNGGIPVHIQMSEPEFQIDWDDVRSHVNGKTRMIVINSPHNPTGSVLSEEDLLNLQHICDRNNLIVLSDEVYHHMVFDGIQHQSVLAFEGLRERSIAVFSFGKIFHATGWKTGFAIASEHITKLIRDVHQFVTFAVNTPIQRAVAEHLSDGNDYFQDAALFQSKRDLFLSELKNPLFEPVQAKGTYFQLLKYRSEVGDKQFAADLTRQHKIASIPISVFYENKHDPKMLRFCIAKEDETIRAGASILNEVSI
jgi:methionine aminotransferase